MKRTTLAIVMVCAACLAGCGGESESADVATGGEAGGSVSEGVAEAATQSPQGLLVRNQPAPAIHAVDIRGRDVDLDAIVAAEPELVVLFFFTTQGGEEFIKKLETARKLLQQKIQIVAFGVREEVEALKEFATALNIDYFVIDKEQIKNEPWLADITALPTTVFVEPLEDRPIIQVVKGGGEGKADMVRRIALTFFQKGSNDEAMELADAAAESGESTEAVTELKGHILTAEGKLDEAEAEFGKINSSAGLAKVAYEKGDFDTALKKANEAGDDGYALMVKGQVLERQGDLDGAQAALDAAVEAPSEDWKSSEAANAKGRLLHKTGNIEDAVKMYDQAVQLSPVNFIALSNEGSAERELGNTDAAEAALAKANALAKGGDDLILLTIKDIAREKERANDQARLAFINQQVKELGERYKELKASGKAEPVDPWSTRPQVLALLPSDSTATFERAGTDIVIRREIEARLSLDPRIRVVERELLDQLLTELNLGSSDIADKDTQLQLGKVLSARNLAFVNFVDAGPDNAMYARLTDTETTELTNLTPQVIKDAGSIETLVQATVEEILARVVEERPLQGLIGDASNPDEVLINLGELHGAKPGMRFMVIKEGEPRVVGGRTIGYKMEKLGEVEVTRVDRDFGYAKITEKRDEAEWPTDTKIKELRADAEEAA